jgi:hypothetical protein
MSPLSTTILLAAYRKVYPKSSRHTAENCFGRLMKKEEFSARVAELAREAATGAVMTTQETQRRHRAMRAKYWSSVGTDFPCHTRP